MVKINTPTSSSSSAQYHIRISGDNPPNLSECVSYVSDPMCGAISTFIGTTRSTFDDRTVTSLKYEGYVPMAEKELISLCETVTDRWSGVSKIAVHHILGDCPVGDTSVIIATSSAHRKEAIESCQWLIDALKESVPIWKLECYEDSGGAVWKENFEWKGGRRVRTMAKSSSGDNEVNAIEEELGTEVQTKDTTHD
mmetsp:Transcript_24212/g.48139  ORF Transcript_24212/g.48139 Transcript_24212/m.48139 type:complete len:196 (+) Transcript_24212:106-693(+)